MYHLQLRRDAEPWAGQSTVGMERSFMMSEHRQQPATDQKATKAGESTKEDQQSTATQAEKIAIELPIEENDFNAQTQ